MSSRHGVSVGSRGSTVRGRGRGRARGRKLPAPVVSPPPSSPVPPHCGSGSGSRVPCTSLNDESDDDCSMPKKRRWTSSVWQHYNIKEGKFFPDGNARAYCKYCNGGPVDADSSNGTSNFRRHTENCSARMAGDAGTLTSSKFFEYGVYKELIALSIIRHGYTYTFAEHEGNRNIHVYLNENCVPISRNTAKNHTLKIHQREKKRLKKSLSQISSRVCLTSDLWTSCVGQGFLSLTAHYIDDDWRLHSKILSFSHMPPPHNAVSLHDYIHNLLKEWGIHKKIFTLTLDNARVNDNMQDMLRDTLNVHARLPCGGDFFHVRCGAHVLNLIVKEGLKLVDEGISKVKYLVKYVTGSEVRKLKFSEIVSSLEIDSSQGLWLDCPIRWNSTYKMLIRALPYRSAFLSMRRLERCTTNFPSLPTDEEWCRIEKICDLLEPFDEITNIISGTNYPTANLYMKYVWKIQNLLTSWSSCEDAFLRTMALKMKGKFEDYWDSYSVILSLAAIFDPRYKFQFVSYCFQKLDPENFELKAKAIKDQLYKLFDEYVNQSPQVNVNTARNDKDYLEGLSNFDNVRTRAYRTSDLDKYLDEYRMDHNLECNVLKWWKDEGHRFPSLSKLAKDILSIPITTVASESCFSMGGRIITKWRASLKPENAEALVTTRSWVFGYQMDADNVDDQELNGLCVQFGNVSMGVGGEGERNEEVEEQEEEEEYLQGEELLSRDPTEFDHDARSLI